ncbi:DnaD domain protein [Carnobacteriaceae bacterium zg-C25]|nr:DnaD domain protein [Carnobacteriaceae bacterium zg-ZUI240]QTU82802.1 DnaD domain protein [Carnobacteriaceae bacterium zg-C25]
MREKIVNLLKQTSTPLPSALFQHYQTLNLTSEEVMLLVQYAIEDGDMERVAKQMHLNDNQLAKMINALLEKQHITMETTTTSDGKIDVVYSMEPIYQKLATLLLQETPTQQANTQDLITTFEQEFGRAFSSIELETIIGWVKEDQFEESLILMALKEAVISQAVNLRYIERILLNWRQKNIKTAQQVQQETRKYRQSLAQDQLLPLDEKTVNVLTMNHTK